MGELALQTGEQMTAPKLAWVGCCALAMKDGVGRIDSLPDSIYRRTIDDVWKVVLNGSKETKKVDGAPELPPFGIYVEFNGWPAGIIGPGGGILAAGDAANEDTFIAAIEAALGSTIESAMSARHAES